MSISVCFYVDTTPIPKGRPRFRSMGKFVQTYTDIKTRSFEALIAEQAKEALLNAPHTKKPDIDNLCKSVLDGMANIVFKNDGQISSLHATKKYGTVGFINVLVREEND